MNDCKAANQLMNKPIDSTFFKKRTAYLSVSPLSLNFMKNTSSGKNSLVYSPRIGINFLTAKRRKFQVFGAIGRGIQFKGGMKTVEIGMTMGKFYAGGESGFFDLNVGLSYFGSETRTPIQSGSFWDGSHVSSTKVDNVNTFGIPLEAMYYTSRLPVGVGVGFIGNLNIEQPYIGVQFCARFGNPVVNKRSNL